MDLFTWELSGGICRLFHLKTNLKYCIGECWYRILHFVTRIHFVAIAQPSYIALKYEGCRNPYKGNQGIYKEKGDNTIFDFVSYHIANK